MLHMIQPGTGPRRPLVLLFLIGTMVYDDLRAALGPEACIVVDDSAGGRDSLAGLVAFAGRTAGSFTPTGLVLGGFSAGCQRVRALLEAGIAAPLPLLAVVTADGTHASLPPAPGQIEVWAQLAAEARAGKLVFAASHTLNVYVETLRAPEVPYMATLHVLQRATGFALATPSVHGEPATVDGGLAVYSYLSGACDAAAHARQETESLPKMLERHVKPVLATVAAQAAEMPSEDTAPPTVPERPITPSMLPPGAVAPTPVTTRDLKAGVTGPDVIAWQHWLDRRALLGLDPFTLSGSFDAATVAGTRRMQNAIGIGLDGDVGEDTRAHAKAWPGPDVKADDGSSTWEDSSLSLGARAVRWSLQFAGREDMEKLGPNTGPEIAGFLAPAIRQATGPPLHLAAGEWCAAFFCAAAEAVAGPGEPIPHGYRAAGVELVTDAKQNGCWREAGLARVGTYQPGEGDGCILQRGGAGSAWETHTCRVVARTATGFWTVGGNEANTVRVTFRRFTDADLLGFLAYG